MIPTKFEWGGAGEFFEPADEVGLVGIAGLVGDVGEFGKAAAVEYAHGCLELGD